MFGQPVGDYQLTQAKLGRMAVIIQAARQFAYEVARLMAKGEGALEASMVKAYVCKAAEWVTREAMQIHGGMGYAEEYAVSRYFVDARVLSIFEGADETLCLKVIARRLVKRSNRPDNAAETPQAVRAGLFPRSLRRNADCLVDPTGSCSSGSSRKDVAKRASFGGGAFDLALWAAVLSADRYVGGPLQSGPGHAAQPRGRRGGGEAGPSSSPTIRDVRFSKLFGFRVNLTLVDCTTESLPMARSSPTRRRSKPASARPPPRRSLMRVQGRIRAADA